MERSCEKDMMARNLKRTLRIALCGGMTAKSGSPLPAGETNRVPRGGRNCQHSENKGMMIHFVNTKTLRYGNQLYGDLF